MRALGKRLVPPVMVTAHADRARALRLVAELRALAPCAAVDAVHDALRAPGLNADSPTLTLQPVAGGSAIRLQLDPRAPVYEQSLQFAVPESTPPGTYQVAFTFGAMTSAQDTFISPEEPHATTITIAPRPAQRSLVNVASFGPTGLNISSGRPINATGTKKKED